MSSSWRISAQIILSLLLFGFVASSAWPHIPMPPKKNEIGRQEVQSSVSDFTLTDQENRRFQFATTRGKLVLATFIFTSCPDVCPLFTAKFAAIERALQEKKRNDYWLLSITTDPERDTPAVLKAYATQYKVDFGHWSFLTGSREELAKVWKAFGVNVRKSSSGQIQHTALTTLIDRDGIRRVNYWGDKWLEAEVLKDFSAVALRTR
jgi:protein SCO1/2